MNKINPVAIHFGGKKIRISVIIPPYLFMLTFFALASTILESCDPKRIFDQTQKVPSKGWHMSQPVYFEHSMDDTLGFYLFYLTVRNNTSYPYSNFYVFLTSYLPDGQVTRDTIELILADLTGKWTGKGAGRIKDNRFLIRSDLKFPFKGLYRFEITHGMRDTLLKGIENVGIRIEKW